MTDTKTNKRRTGSRYEDKACEFLQKQGLKIIERNFRCKKGEIDIIARDEKTVVFLEVKYRKNKSMGFPCEAVDQKKQATISAVADFYRIRYKLSDETAYRFDVISIMGDEIKWYKNAFDYCGYC
ncbi:MAG: YraN family protein [Lachnospiraceae bacterium]|nr:YraN family protein [Lachnospiraceae bacterium]